MMHSGDYPIEEAWIMRRLLLGLSSVLAAFSLVTGLRAQTTPTPGPESVYISNLRDNGPAPEIYGESWLNTERPLRLRDLAGQVVLLDMWTFDCINCIHIVPSLRDWHERYADQGLVIIGNHFPEFQYEHDFGNLRAAMERLEIPYAVTQDNAGLTWDAYGNRYWPTIYLIDKRGHLRYQHIGEGGYDRTEAAIEDLLAETYTPDATPVPSTPLPYLTPTSELNVRAEATTESAIIGGIRVGEVFVIRGALEGWYRIAYNDGEGYVSAAYVTVTEPT
jgi:thiol-disulfide isomerase/thioredoxin